MEVMVFVVERLRADIDESGGRSYPEKVTCGTETSHVGGR